MAIPCRICGRKAVALAPVFGDIARVGSDSTPFGPGGEIGQCRACGAVQKPLTKAFSRECEAIYAGYTMYGQSSTGSEPKVFSAEPTHRSALIAQAFCESLDVPEHGRLLDVGCGNGGLLRAFAGLRPDWRLAGLEKDRRNRSALELLPGFEVLYEGDPDPRAELYDIISLVHVLEHIPDPVGYLTRLCSLLAPGGAMVIHLPLWQQNPFDLTVADHSLHFDANSIRRTLAGAGVSPVFMSDTVISRELTVIAHDASLGGTDIEADVGPSIGLALDWLRKTGDLARRCRMDSPENFGVFGTGNGAVWATQTAGSAGFYVDEDPSRIGHHYLDGTPVLSPSDVPSESQVFISLPPTLAEEVRDRNRHCSGRWHIPPPLPSGLRRTDL